MKGSVHVIVFSIALGLVCALLLTAAAEFTRPYVQANKDAEEKRNVLAVLGIPFDPKAPAAEVVEIFNANVREDTLGELEIYVYSPADAEGAPIQAVAVPFIGPGLWGKIKGFLALEPDLMTIRGLTFYEHEETPGLGGEIDKPWFRDQFVGKRIVDEAGVPGVRILREGGATGASEVDAITGATMTSDKVEAMLRDVMAQIIEERESDE